MGSVENRGKGSFRLSVITGYDELGKPVRERRTVKARNKTEAKKELAKFETEILQGDYSKPTEKRLHEFREDWWELHAKQHLSERTRNEYDFIVRNKILPAFGHMKLSEIKPMHLAAFIAELREPESRKQGEFKPLAPSTIHNHAKALNSLMSVAKEWGLIKENPADNLRLPKMQRKTKTTFSTEIVNRLVEGIKKEPFEKQVMFWLTFVSGCREGELVALETKHILEEENAILLEQSLSQLKNGDFELKETKNGVDGMVAIPEELMQMVKKIKTERKRAYMQLRDIWWDPERVFLFSNAAGKPYRPDSINQWWGRFRRKNKIKGVRFHDLRHFSITYLIQMGIHPKAISSRARHKKMGTTMDVYGHRVEEVDIIAAKQFEKFFEEKKLF